MDDMLTPQELIEEGKSAYKRGDFTVAARAYQAAAQGYEATGERAHGCRNVEQQQRGLFTRR